MITALPCSFTPVTIRLTVSTIPSLPRSGCLVLARRPPDRVAQPRDRSLDDLDTGRRGGPAALRRGGHPVVLGVLRIPQTGLPVVGEVVGVGAVLGLPTGRRLDVVEHHRAGTMTAEPELAAPPAPLHQ